MPSNDLLSSLGLVGQLFYTTMTKRLTGEEPYPPGSDNKRGFSTIQDATSVGQPFFRGEEAMIEIRIDLGLAPYAWAYEVGSGVHGRKKATYPIKPVNFFAMVFPKEDWPDWEDWGGPGVYPNAEDLFVLIEVDHPGVEAKPYIRPTITEIKDEVKKILARDFKVSVLRELRGTP